MIVQPIPVHRGISGGGVERVAIVDSELKRGPFADGKPQPRAKTRGEKRRLGVSRRLRLAVFRRRFFLRAVQLCRTVFAIVCAFGWLAGALHENLEAAEWMLDHRHHGPAHHAHEGDGAHSGNSAENDGDHDPVWARGEGQIGFSTVVVLLLGVLAFFTLLRPFSLRPATAWTTPRPEDPPLSAVWQFVQRCAACSAAPPVLN